MEHSRKAAERTSRPSMFPAAYHRARCDACVHDSWREIMPRFSWAATASLLLMALSASTAKAQWFEDSDSPWVPYVSGTLQGSSIELDSGGTNLVGLFKNYGEDTDDTYALGGALGV